MSSKPMPGADRDELMTTKEVAAFLRLNPNTLEQWRSRGRGPTFERAGVAVRYRLSEVEDWIRRNGGPHGLRQA